MKSDNEVMEAAKKAAENAYCPYSKFPVGACIEFESGNIYTGCNVENASYGLALCAERNAISSAVSAGEKSKLTRVAIYSPKSEKCFPCGACRQWIYEFSKGYNTKIILEDKNEEICIFYIKDILPYAFDLI